MKKKAIVPGLIALAALAAFIMYYIYLPAVNIHSAGFWYFLMLLIIIAIAGVGIGKMGNGFFKLEQRSIVLNTSALKSKLIKALLALLAAVFLIYLVGNILSSPIVNADKYQRLLNIEDRNFTEDIKEADYNTIPLLDRSSAAILGNRKLGSLVDMVSQFEVSNDYAQINYKGKPVRVTPLAYADVVKWFMNRSSGIPGYILIDMATQNTELVRLPEGNGIRYSNSEHFGRYLMRHLRFRYPTYIFDDELFFEIDEEGTPFWVCPVKKFNIGLFGGQTVGRVVLCNAVTGECTDYDLAEVPSWVDKVHSAELLVRLYDYHGIYSRGFINSIFGQRDCLQSTNGYNYIALDDDVWVYTGITSVNGDQSNVGFVLMNQRTMETRYYKVEGAIEDSAMSSAEGQVQNLGYVATFPLLLNISGEPTYFMALKDASGLVKKYAMVNVQKYQWVAVGDTIRDCERTYSQLLSTNGIVSHSESFYESIAGQVEVIAPVVISGNTHYYIILKGSKDVYDVNIAEESLLGVLLLKEGDRVELSYEAGNGLHEVREINP